MVAPNEPRVFVRRVRWSLLALTLGLAVTGPGRAADNRPVAGPGATREAVLDAYGEPSGQSQLGGKEIFTYPQGQIILRDGVVERMDFSPNVPWPKPKPRVQPGAASPASPVAPEKPLVVNPWITDYERALVAAQQTRSKILALFTGMDWSPASRQFQNEVALHPDFITRFSADYVLLRLDFPRTTVQAPELKKQNAELRERFEVTAYPTILILASDGRLIKAVDLSKPRTEPTYREQLIGAIAETDPKPVSTTAWLTKPDIDPAAAAAAAPGAPKPTIWEAYRKWLLGGLAFLLFLIWRKVRGERLADEPAKESPSAMPTASRVAGWSREATREVCVALFEFEGHRVERLADNAELALFAPGRKRATTIVRCHAAADGLAGVKPVRDLLGTVMAEGASTGWLVTPAGYVAEARAFAQEHGLILLGMEEFLERLQAVPPLILNRVTSPGRR